MRLKLKLGHYPTLRSYPPGCHALHELAGLQTSPNCRSCYWAAPRHKKPTVPSPRWVLGCEHMEWVSTKNERLSAFLGSIRSGIPA